MLCFSTNKETTLENFHSLVTKQEQLQSWPSVIQNFFMYKDKHLVGSLVLWKAFYKGTNRYMQNTQNLLEKIQKNLMSSDLVNFHSYYNKAVYLLLRAY